MEAEFSTAMVRRRFCNMDKGRTADRLNLACRGSVLPTQESASSRSSSPASKSERSSSWSIHHHKPSAGKESPPQNQTQLEGYGTGLPRSKQPDSSSSEVKGFLMEASGGEHPNRLLRCPMMALGLVFMVHLK